MNEMFSIRDAADRGLADGLLAADEPRPFAIENAEGPTPLVLIADHASHFIPRAFGNLGLNDANLLRHVAWDIGIAEVTRRLAERLDAAAVLSNFSRLVIDPNRCLDTPESIMEVSDGIPVPGNVGLDAAARQRRVAAFFDPYHAAIDGLLDGRIAQGRQPVLVSMHSFTPVMDSFERPWKLGILWNEDPRLPLPMIRRLRDLGLTVGDNEPYSGRDAHGYSQHVHGDARGLANVLIEVRQDLIDTHHGAEEWSALLADVLREILMDPALYLPFETHNELDASP